MKTGIYLITNTVNGNVYVGSTIRTFKLRFKEHRWKLNKGAHHCKRLQRAWNLYGANSFEFTVVENCNEDDIQEQESFWINYLKYIGVELYNAILDPIKAYKGYVYSKEQIQKIKDNRKFYDTLSRDFALLSPDGTVYRGKNVAQFAAEHKLSRGTLINLINGEKDFYNGWQVYQEGMRIRPFSAKVINPSGIVFTITDIRQFAQEHNLDAANLSKLINHVVNKYKGWKRA